jgi:hypothetical protein
VRRQPVAGLDHFTCGFGVERLVRIGDGLAAEAEEERQNRNQQEQESRARHAQQLYKWIIKLWLKR